MRLCSDPLRAGLDSQLDHRLHVRNKSNSGALPAGSGLVTLDGICRMVESREDFKVLGGTCTYLTGKSTISSPADALTVLLHLCRGWNATDPKDQVYSLLGLVPAVAHPSVLNKADHQIFKADYTKSDREVFIECATWIIKETRWLGYLTLVENRSVQNDMELPTWVPDLTKVPPMRLGTQVDILKHGSLLRGQAHRKRDTTFPNVVGDILHCAGARMGTITQISTPIFDLCNGLSTFEDGSKIILSSPQTYPYTKEPRDDVLWKTLTGCEHLYPSSLSHATSVAYPTVEFGISSCNRIESGGATARGATTGTGGQSPTGSGYNDTNCGRDWAETTYNEHEKNTKRNHYINPT
ncbi:hypothetical protein B0J13DRAFT_636387 [Dactylonectria estremocensis]|uniref:Uncharacterized protein n=1 Tax=Dactylonectria estremocensis TaxID=1079267 RepID=A0A9P9ESI8_9HYPO|nr:hypothetical protein B0J13DRAFT_636387 [Dactylonectria estremocensis]